MALTLFVGARSFTPFDGGINALEPYADPDIALKAGHAAPAFSLPDASNQIVSLEDFKGKKGVLLLFYRGSWCPYCVSQLDDIQNLLPTLSRYGVQLLAISPDNAKKSAKLAERFNRPYVFLADQDLAVAEAYGLKKNRKLPHPAIFLVDQEGKVIWYHVDQNYKQRPSALQLKAVLNSFFGPLNEQVEEQKISTK